MNGHHEPVLHRPARRCRGCGIVIPTFARQKDPALNPPAVRERLKSVAMNDLDSANVLRITWKNEPIERGGTFDCALLG